MRVTAISSLAKTYPKYYRDKMRLANPRAKRKKETTVISRPRLLHLGQHVNIFA